MQLLRTIVHRLFRKGKFANNWRDDIDNCAPDCGENQHYTSSGTACPATCATPEPVCNEINVEGCQCNDGLVWSDTTCVHQSECGCTTEGAYYEVGASYTSTDCKTECTCASANNPVCQSNNGCDDNEVCEARKNIRKCYCKRGFFLDPNDGKCYERSTCRICGDPHYKQFDATVLHFQGSCTYTLAASKPGAPNQFTIVGTNLQRNPNRHVTVLASIVAYVDGSVIQFGYDTTNVRIDGVITSLTYKQGQVTIRRRPGGGIILVTDFGLQIIYDGRHCLRIRVPTIPFNNFVHGLCGLLSGTQSDDLTTPDGTIVTDTNEFGNSWENGTVSCTNPCTAETCEVDTCETFPEAVATAQEECKYLTADADGPFKTCLEAYPDLGHVGDCEFDVCGGENNKCSYYEQLFTDCSEKGKFANNWRDDIDNCAPDCGENQHYTSSGTACPATCATPEPVCNEINVEGCQCDEGFVLSDTTCVEQSECGCTDAGVYYENGENFVNDICTKKYTCTTGTITLENDLVCDPNAECKVDSGIRNCYCKPPYYGEGNACISPCEPIPNQNPCLYGGICKVTNDPSNENGYYCVCPEDRVGDHCEEGVRQCSAWGDPHYTNCDGSRQHFQGDCAYAFMKECSTDPNNPIPSFVVYVKNERLGTRPVSVTREVTTILPNGQTVVIGQGKVVQVGVAPNLVTLQNNDFTYYGSGFTISKPGDVVLKTDFGLTVKYDGRHRIRVLIPDSFSGQVCGLCGNCNDDNTDDRRKPNTDYEPNLNIWGHSWAKNGTICEACDDCPSEDVCDDVDPAVRQDAEARCGIIQETSSSRKKRSSNVLNNDSGLLSLLRGKRKSQFFVFFCRKQYVLELEPKLRLLAGI
ncbi:zonadhesin-like [Amphiura filiformis]|uniref:zonadhesin-like n=1 Tax=Amphiura filiformis TaxID=82378 RepID=UPI003B20FC95